MTIEEQFSKFYENIKLTPAQRQDAVDKYTGVCKKLHDHYYPSIKYTGTTKILIGSYGKRTHIRPARDIDVVFIMPPEKFGQYSDNLSNGQSQLLQRIKTILEEKYHATPIKAFGKVVLLEFSETNHNVEVVPAWEYDDGTFCIPNSKDGGSWERINYRKEIAEIVDSNTTTGRTKFLIRVGKKWSDNCSANVSSYQIEQSVLIFLSDRDTSALDTDIFVRDFFHHFYGTVYDQQLKSHLATAYSRAQKACDFRANHKFDLSTDEWKKILGNDFPSDEGEIPMVHSPATLALLPKKYPAPKEEFLDRDYGIPFQINPAYEATIDAEVTKQKGFRDGWLSSFIRRKLPLLKQKTLEFSITHNVPPPYDLKWKIRNFGDEAERAGSLRGEIHNDAGHETREERTLYHGEHYVEAYLIKNGVCVAVGRIVVPIGNNY